MKQKMTIGHTKNLILIFAFFLALFSCSKNDDEAVDGPGDAEGTLPNIAELAQSVNRLSTLVNALEATDAGLLERLSGEGTFTVFAPTNDAFTALFDGLEGYGSLDDFDGEGERELLAELLKYHVINGTAAFSNTLSDGTELETLQTEGVQVSVDVSVFIKDKTDDLAEVVSADNEASNGVVHIVDKILLPQAVLDQLFPKPNLVELVAALEALSLLEQALLSANLTDTLGSEGPFTLFAPSNEAIQALFDALGDEYNGFEDFDNIIERQVLEGILLYHVVNGKLGSMDLTPGIIPTLLSENSIEVLEDGDTLVIGDATDTNANLLAMDQEASNGMVHVIDKILIPQQALDLLDLSGGTSGKTLKELVVETEEFSFLE